MKIKKWCIKFVDWILKKRGSVKLNRTESEVVEQLREKYMRWAKGEK